MLTVTASRSTSKKKPAVTTRQAKRMAGDGCAWRKYVGERDQDGEW
jgi:hypothetical protein